MSRRQFAELGDIRFVPTIVNTAAPTAAEVIAGTRITPQMLRDGLSRPQEGNTADASDAASLYNKQAPGTFGGQPMTIKCYRDSKSATDVAWTTLARLTSGYIVVTDWGWAQAAGTGLGSNTGTPTAGDRCEVWPITVNSRAMMDTAENENAKFTATCVVTDVPNQNAVVA